LEEKKKLRRIVSKEIEEQDALITSKKVKKISKEILKKIFYIDFKVI